MSACGEEKALLQALIRAAGVYIKWEHGFDAAAVKMATKALPVLTDNTQRLAVYIDPERLLAALRVVTGKPPRLLHETFFPVADMRQG